METEQFFGPNGCACDSIFMVNGDRDTKFGQVYQCGNCGHIWTDDNRKAFRKLSLALCIIIEKSPELNAHCPMMYRKTCDQLLEALS
jgi:hypothetical protein